MMHIFDYGVEIRLDTDADLSTAQEARILYKKPSGKTGYWNAVVDGDTLVYLTQPGDIDEAGIWILQSYVRGITYELTGKKVFIMVKERVA